MLALREWEASLLQIAFQYFTRLLSQVAYIYLFSWLKLCDIARAKFFPTTEEPVQVQILNVWIKLCAGL